MQRRTEPLHGFVLRCCFLRKFFITRSYKSYKSITNNSFLELKMQTMLV